MKEKKVLKRRKKYRRELVEMKAKKSLTKPKSNLIRFPYVEQAAKKWNKAVGKIVMDKGWDAVPVPKIQGYRIIDVLTSFQYFLWALDFVDPDYVDAYDRCMRDVVNFDKHMRLTGRFITSKDTKSWRREQYENNNKKA